MNQPNEWIKSKAQAVFDHIAKGWDKATKRPKNESIDRALRRLIEEANSSGEACIINVGNGYYKVRKDNIRDRKEFVEYIATERARALKILHKCKMMIHYLDMQDQIEFMEWFNGTLEEEVKDGT